MLPNDLEIIHYEMLLCKCLCCDNCQNHVLTTESIFCEPAPQIKALVRNLSAFTTLFAKGKSWDNVRSTAAPYTESRLARLVRNKRVGFPVVEQNFVLILYIFNLKREGKSNTPLTEYIIK